MYGGAPHRHIRPALSLICGVAAMFIATLARQHFAHRRTETRVVGSRAGAPAAASGTDAELTAPLRCALCALVRRVAKPNPDAAAIFRDEFYPGNFEGALDLRHAFVVAPDGAVAPFHTLDRGQGDPRRSRETTLFPSDKGARRAQLVCRYHPS
jgi:hypothetical protein